MTTTTPPADADLAPYLRVHRALRESAAAFADVAGRPAANRTRRARARWARGFVGEIRCHHHIEDALLFPALAARVATYDAYGPRLQNDHDELDEVLDGLLAAVAGRRPDLGRAGDLAVELRDHLDEHLGYEDDEIVPLFARHLTSAELQALNERAARMTSPRQLLFTAPWLMSRCDPEEQRDVLAAAPGALRLLWLATRGRYARLAGRALAA